LSGFYISWIFRSKLSHYSGQTEPPQNYGLKTLSTV
jgi:hypothetical protein